MPEPFTMLGLCKLASAHHAWSHMAGAMLNSEDPPLCTNVNHNAIVCAESDLPRVKWCEACRSHAERHHGN